jgi:hypothetical protein
MYIYLIDKDSNHEFARKMKDKYDVRCRLYIDVRKHVKDIITAINDTKGTLILATNDEQYSRYMTRLITKGQNVILLCDGKCKETKFMKEKIWKTYYVIDGRLQDSLKTERKEMKEETLPEKKKEVNKHSRDTDDKETPPNSKRRKCDEKKDNRSYEQKEKERDETKTANMQDAFNFLATLPQPTQQPIQQPIPMETVEPVEKNFCQDFILGCCQKGIDCDKIHKCKRCMRVSKRQQCIMECSFYRKKLCHKNYFCDQGLKCKLAHTKMERAVFLNNGGVGFAQWKCMKCIYYPCERWPYCTYTHDVTDYFCVFCKCLAGHYEADCPVFSKIILPDFIPPLSKPMSRRTVVTRREIANGVIQLT